MTITKHVTTADAVHDSGDAVIRATGLRVTQSRLAVYQALAERPHARADEVYERVRVLLPETSLQSVYNALGDFTKVGIVRRIDPDDNSNRFELHAGDNHHHLVCLICNAVEDIDCAVEQAPCHTPPEDHGFTIEKVEVVYRGVCPSCAAKQNT